MLAKHVTNQIFGTFLYFQDKFLFLKHFIY